MSSATDALFGALVIITWVLGGVLLYVHLNVKAQFPQGPGLFTRKEALTIIGCIGLITGIYIGLKAWL